MSSGPLIRRNSHISFMIRRRACNASTPGEVNIDGATIYANVIQIFILFVYFFFMETLPRWILSDLWWWWWGGGRRKEEHLRLWKSTGARPINRIMKLKMKEDQRDE